MRTLLAHGASDQGSGVSVPLFSEEVQQGRVLGRHEPLAGYHGRDLYDTAKALGTERRCDCTPSTSSCS